MGVHTDATWQIYLTIVHGGYEWSATRSDDVSK